MKGNQLTVTGGVKLPKGLKDRLKIVPTIKSLEKEIKLLCDENSRLRKEVSEIG